MTNRRSPRQRHWFLGQFLVALIICGITLFSLKRVGGPTVLPDAPLWTRTTAAPVTTNTAPPVIAYAISMTSCELNDGRLDQAAVVLYSIHQNSIRNGGISKYDYKTYAFVHPDAKACAEALTQIGYDDVSIRESPVLKQEIKGELKDFVHEASCCEEKEFLKLYSYTLTNHSVAVHLDVDYLILRPLDHLFDAMIEGPSSPARSKIQIQWPKDQAVVDSKRIEAFFTRDYNLVNPGVRLPHQIGIQGGLMILKTDMNIFEQYKAIIIEGNYTRDDGWGGKLRYGGYYGAAQIQGLCSYFFGAIRPNTAVELDRCQINWMADDPRDEERGNQCRTLQTECNDCRKVPFEDIYSVHYTICTKPWWCLANEENGKSVDEYIPLQVCKTAILKWFTMRRQLEAEWSKRDEVYKTELESYNKSVQQNYDAGRKEDVNTLSFCSKAQYIPMWLPKRRIAL